MGTGWRRAFCTSVRRDSDATHAVIGGGSHSNPSTPRNQHQLHCKTAPASAADVSAVATPVKSGSARAFSSPSLKSPSKFALFKSALRFSSRNRCGICSESMRSGGGGERTAVFTAECSHAFHFPCISTHVRTQGCLVCPVCSATWHEVPLLSSSLASATAPPPPPLLGNRSNRAAASAKIYNDDESLHQLSPNGGITQFNTIPEEFDEAGDEDSEGSDAIGLSLISNSAVLVSTGRTHITYVVPITLKAPPHANTSAPLLDHPSCRAPIDLVTVLDVGGSMTPAKLQMLKRAMRLVVHSLCPGDRLSIVAFSAAAAKRLLPLRRMSRPGQRSALQIVDRLVVCGTAHAEPHAADRCPSSKSCVGDALRKATKVLEDRRERNPVATIMLLSDGHGQQPQQHDPPAHNSAQNHGTRFNHFEIPIESSGSDLISKQQKLVDIDEDSSAFAKHVNGLVSVVLQNVHLQFSLPSPSGVISSIYSYSGGCSAGIAQSVAHGEGGRSVHIGDMFADEERQLLVEIKVPKAAVLSENSTSLPLSVVCGYTDPVSRDAVRCGEQPVLVPMPLQFTSEQLEMRSVFVATRAMAESRRLVELGDLDTAVHLLSSARSLLLQQNSAPSSSNKKLVLGLEAELEDVQGRRKWLQQQKSLSPSYRRTSEQALLAETRGGAEPLTPRGGEPLTPTSAWRAAEQLAKVAIMKKSVNRVRDLHGLENARF